MPQKYANLRSEAQGFITDWLCDEHYLPDDKEDNALELHRGAQIIEAQMHEIDRLTTYAMLLADKVAGLLSGLPDDVEVDLEPYALGCLRALQEWPFP